MKYLKTITSLLSLGFLAVMSLDSHGQTIANPGFDDYTGGGTGAGGQPKNGDLLSALTPASWGIVGTDGNLQIKEVAAGGLVAQSGGYYMGFFGTTSDTSGISQTITTTPGQRYELGYYLARQTTAGAPMIDIDVYDGTDFKGANLATTTTTIDWARFVWEKHTTTFTATSETTTLRFLENTTSPTSGVDPFVDTVTIAPIAFEFFEITSFVRTADSATLTFPSKAGESFNIFRSTDLTTGFDTPLVADLPAAEGVLTVTSTIGSDGFLGLDLVDEGDPLVDFDTALTSDTSYVFIRSDGTFAGTQTAIVSWSGNTVTLAEDISTDLSWSGPYTIQTLGPDETSWTDTSLPAGGKAFFRVKRH
ncbi:MAG: DUF642 domain-containing protein [Akkermansiaceae bacterium]|jgi:hypothetical protein